MPRTVPQNKEEDIFVKIYKQRSTYFPGDTLTGHVIVSDSQPQHDATAKVKIRLFGRAKSERIVQRKATRVVSRGNVVFFEEQQTLEIKSTSSTAHWPFSITIPRSPKPGFGARGDEFPPGVSFRATLESAGGPERDVASDDLPSSVYLYHESPLTWTTVEGLIEYVLVAQMDDRTAEIPLYVRQPSIFTPIMDFQMHTRVFMQVIKTANLVPRPANREPKSTAFSALSRRPRYLYYVKVEYPRVIQLEHPEPFPMKIYLVPDLGGQNTTICRDGNIGALPSVEVVSMELKLSSELNIRCPGTVWESSASKSDSFVFHFSGKSEPTVVPVDYGVGEAWITPQVRDRYGRLNTPVTPLGSPDALHLGRLFSIYLGCSATSTMDNPPVSFGRQMYPSFSTYNISLEYRLHWKINLVCAGEAHSVSTETPITVLATSEEQEALKMSGPGMLGLTRTRSDPLSVDVTTLQFIGRFLRDVPC